MKNQSKKRKIKIPFEDEDKDEYHLRLPINQIQIGDIGISSKNSLRSCKKVLKEIVKDKTLKNYLDIYSKKKIMGGVSYIG